MSRASAIALAHAYFDDGTFLDDLSRRIAIPSSSQEPQRAAALRAYLEDELVLSLASLGFQSRVSTTRRPVLAAVATASDALYEQEDLIEQLNQSGNGE